MIELETLYLRFLDNCVEENLIYNGIEQAKELHASTVRLFGNSTKDKEQFKRIVNKITSLNMKVELDINIHDIDVDLIEFIKMHAELVKFGLNVTPPFKLNSRPINYEGLLINLKVTNDNIEYIPDIIDCYIYKYKVGRIKLFFNLYSIGDYSRYNKFTKYILKNYPEYGEKLYAAMPYILLDQSNIKLARKVCNYHKVVGLCSDGAVIACGIKRTSFDNSFNIKDRSLADIIKSNSKIKQIHTLKPDDLVGVCKICVFKFYCGNICPAEVYNHTGSFNKSFIDCQILYDKGLFPNEYLTV